MLHPDIEKHRPEFEKLMGTMLKYLVPTGTNVEDARDDGWYSARDTIHGAWLMFLVRKLGVDFVMCQYMELTVN